MLTIFVLLVSITAVALASICPTNKGRVRYLEVDYKRPEVTSASQIIVSISQPDGPVSFILQMRDVRETFLELVAVLDGTMYIANKTESDFGLSFQNIKFTNEDTLPSVESIAGEDHFLLVRIRTEDGISLRATIKNKLDFEFQTENIVNNQII